MEERGSLGQASRRPTARRHFTFAGHVAIEFLVGVALAASALALDFSEGALIAALVLGVAIATSALSTSVFDHAISAHKSWDRVLVAVLVATTVASAIASAGIETLVFAVAAAVEGTLLGITRYIPERT